MKTIAEVGHGLRMWELLRSMLLEHDDEADDAQAQVDVPKPIFLSVADREVRIVDADGVLLP